MSENKINAAHHNISEIILSKNIKYLIPDFQRDFVWGEKEIESLINDFLEDSEEFVKETDELSGYLLGNIVLIGNGKEQTVVDGQQRLTTLTIIFKALQKYAEERVQENKGEYLDQWANYNASLKKGYLLTNDLLQSLGLKIQHDKTLSFGDYYKKLMEDRLPDGYEPEKEADRNIREIYDYVSSFLDNDLNELQVIRFINYLSYNVYIIKTVAPNESKAFQLFEVLNDRGRSLEPLDLIKNLFLKNISSSPSSEKYKEEFLSNWRKFADHLEYPSKKDGRRNKISSSKFLTNYILAFEGLNIKKNKLFDHYKDKNKNITSQSLVDFSQYLKDVSEVYSRIEMGEYNYFHRNSENQMKILFEIIGSEQSKAMLMPFYFIPDPDDKLKILDAIIRYVGAVIFSFTQANRIEAFIPRLVTEYNKIKNNDNSIDNLIKFIDKEIKIYTELIKDNLPTRRLENKNGSTNKKAVNIYRFIEGYYCKKSDALYPETGKKHTIEHIMSRKIKDYQYSSLDFRDGEEFQQHLNRIGNLTLIYSTDNSSLGNKNFKDKLPHYKINTFYLTRKLAEELTTEVKAGKDTKLVKTINRYISTPSLRKDKHHFTKEMITKRSEEVASLLADILNKSI